MHPELRVVPPYKDWTFAGNMTRMPEVVAPRTWPSAGGGGYS